MSLLPQVAKGWSRRMLHGAGGCTGPEGERGVPCNQEGGELVWGVCQGGFCLRSAKSEWVFCARLPQGGSEDAAGCRRRQGPEGERGVPCYQ